MSAPPQRSGYLTASGKTTQVILFTHHRRFLGPVQPGTASVHRLSRALAAQNTQAMSHFIHDKKWLWILTYICRMHGGCSILRSGNGLWFLGRTLDA